MSDDPLLHEMDDDTLVATAKMSAQCLTAGLDMSVEAGADLINELADRLVSPPGGPCRSCGSTW